MKNSRGGQEGSEGPGVAAARRARLPLLFSVRGSQNKKAKGESPEDSAALSDYKRRLSVVRLQM